MIASPVRHLWHYRDLIRNLVARDLREKYKGSTLGFAWSLLHPLLMAAVYTLAFTYIVRIQIEHFPVFLLAGLLPWIFHSTALLTATVSIGDNGSLVRKVAFPRGVLPLAAVASQFVQFCLMYGVLVPLAFVLDVGVWPGLVAVVPLLVLQFVFTTGLALLLATAYVYFRDTRHLLEVLLQIWFWVTPVVYSLALVPPGFRFLFQLNPMTHFVTAYRTVVLDHGLPSLETLLVLLALATGGGFAGLAVFSRHERRFAELV